MTVIINYHFPAEEMDHPYFGDGSQAFGDLRPACLGGLAMVPEKRHPGRTQSGGLG